MDKDKIMQYAPWAIAALALILALVSLISVGSAKKQAKAAEAAAEDLSRQVEELRLSEGALRTTVAILEEQASQAQTAPAAPAAPETPSGSVAGLKISWQPMNVETLLDRKDALFLKCMVEGTFDKLTMTWQYQDVTGAWKDIEFVAPGYNKELGLRLYDNAANGESQLWANGLTEKAFTSYRCLVTASDGSQLISDVAAATVRTE